MKKQVVIIHYNTPELTAATVRSLRRVTPDCEIAVFDNSDRRPFPEIEGVRRIDNTRGQLIDFHKMIERYPDRQEHDSNYGSEKHIASVDYLFDMFPDGFVLMDSDILLKKDISDFFDESVAFTGKVQYKPRTHDFSRRVYPFLLWINVQMCREHGIRFWHEGKVFKLSHSGAPFYDTGGSFYDDCIKADLPFKELDIFSYMEHLGGGSWASRESWIAWLEKNRYLYDNKTEDKMEEYLVVIPFFAGGAQGREIEYAVAGWRRHFKEKFKIVIVGDYHPVVETGDDIVFVPCERVPEQKYENYRPHIDFVKKFKAVHEKFPKSKGFIFVADDVYAVNNFDIWDIMCLKQNGDEISVPSLQTPWNREKFKTKNLLRKEGYPVRNFTTHLPNWFDWDKLEALWDKYDMEHESYIIEDLYFNIYYPDRIPLQLHIDHDNFKCGVYRPNPRLPYIDKAFKTKIWIQNSVEGWIPYLDNKLASYYGL